MAIPYGEPKCFVVRRSHICTKLDRPLRHVVIACFRGLYQNTLLLGNWIFRGIGSGRGLRGGCRLKTESDPCSPPTLESA